MGQSTLCFIRLIFVQYGNSEISYRKRVTLSYIFDGKICDQMCIFFVVVFFFIITYTSDINSFYI